MRRSDFSSGIGPASLPSWALPSPDRRRSLGVRMNDFSPPPPPAPSCHGLDIGRCVETHACPGRPALRGFTIVRCCGSPRASTPHALTGKAAAVQCQPRSRAAASGFWLPPIGPIKDSHLLSFIHVQRTPSLRHPACARRHTPARGDGQPKASPSSVQCGKARGCPCLRAGWGSKRRHGCRSAADTQRAEPRMGAANVRERAWQLRAGANELRRAATTLAQPGKKA